MILCYHGISLDEEHLWRPSTYISPELFGQRLETISRGGYAVLPLAEAVDRLYRKELPPRSVVITFDDGTYDFYQHAFPLLKAHGFPSTVYQTTYYCDYDRPIFNLACSYILWKQRGKVLDGGSRFDLPETMDLRTETLRQAMVTKLVTTARERNLPEAEKNQIAEDLASAVGVDYQALVAKRVLQLMNTTEIEHLAREGVDFQLHTHRHRTPMDEALFRREIRDNRRRVQSIIGAKSVNHFCYPSGLYELEFLPWLQTEGVVSGTTCDPGLATPGNNPLLLPRFVDMTQSTALEFEGWLSGAAEWIPRRGNRIRNHPVYSEQVMTES
jgi:peptidoglycan/xylan/chitin deacetylase (PgdA/CDA1 family)